MGVRGLITLIHLYVYLMPLKGYVRPATEEAY